MDYYGQQPPLEGGGGGEDIGSDANEGGNYNLNYYSSSSSQQDHAAAAGTAGTSSNIYHGFHGGYYPAQQDMMRYHGTQYTQYPSSDNRPTLEDAEGLLHLASQVTALRHPVPDSNHNSSLESACMSREARYATHAPPMKKRAIDPSLFNLEGDGRCDETQTAVDEDLTQTKEYGLLSLLAEKALEESNAMAAAAAAREQLHDKQKQGDMDESTADAEEDRPVPRPADVVVTKDTKKSAVEKETKETESSRGTSKSGSPTNEEDIEFKIRALVHGEHGTKPIDPNCDDDGKEKGQGETKSVPDSTTDIVSAVRNADPADSSESVPPEPTVDDKLPADAKMEDDVEPSRGIDGVPKAGVGVADERQPDAAAPVAAPSNTSLVVSEIVATEVEHSRAPTPTPGVSDDPTASATEPIGPTRTADIISENADALDGASSAEGIAELATVEAGEPMVAEAIVEASAVRADCEDGPSDAAEDEQPEARAAVLEVVKEQNLITDEKDPCAPPSQAATDHHGTPVAPSDLDGDKISRAAALADGASSAEATAELATVEADYSMVAEAIVEASAVRADCQDDPSDAAEDKQPEARATVLELVKEQNLITDEKDPCAPPSQAATDHGILSAPNDLDGDKISRAAAPAPPSSTDPLEHSQQSNNVNEISCEQAASAQIETEDNTERPNSDGEPGEVDNPEKSQSLDAQDSVMKSDFFQANSDGAEDEIVGTAGDSGERSDHTDLTQTQALEKSDDGASAEKSDQSNDRSPAEHVPGCVPPSSEVGTGAQMPVDNNNSEAEVDNEISSCNETTELTSAVSSGMEAEHVETAVEKIAEPSSSILPIFESSDPIEEKEKAKDAISAIRSTSPPDDGSSGKIGIDDIGNHSTKGESSSLRINEEEGVDTPQTGVNGVYEEPDEEIAERSTAEIKFDSEMPQAAEAEGAGIDEEPKAPFTADIADVVIHPASDQNEDGPHIENERLNLADLQAQKSLNEDENRAAEGPDNIEKPMLEPDVEEMASPEDMNDESSDVDVADNSVFREDGGVDPLACTEDLCWDAEESDKLEDEIKANANDMMSIESDPKSRDGDEMQHIIDPVTNIAVSAQVAQGESDTKLTADLEPQTQSTEDSKAKLHSGESTAQVNAEVSGIVASDLTKVVTDVNLIASTEEAAPPGGEALNQDATAAEKSPPNDSEQRTGSHSDQAATVAENIPLDHPNLSTDGAEQPSESEEKTNVDEALCLAETENVDATSPKSSSLVEEPLVEDESAQGSDDPQPQGLYNTVNDPHHSSEEAFHVTVDPPLRQNETSEEVDEPKASYTPDITDADIPANSELGVVGDQDEQAKHRDEVSEGGLNSTPAMSVSKDLPEEMAPKRADQAKNEMAASSQTDPTNLCPAERVDETLVEDHPEALTSCTNPADLKKEVLDEKRSSPPSSDVVVDKQELESDSERNDPTRAKSESSADQTGCKDGDAAEVAPRTAVVKPTRNEESRDANDPTDPTAELMKKSSSAGLLSMDNGGHFSLDNVLSPGADLIDISADLMGGPTQHQETLNSNLALAGGAMFDDLDAFDFDAADKHMVGDSGTNKPSASHSLGDIVAHSQMSNLPPDVTVCVNNTDALTSMALASDELLDSLVVAGNAEPNAANAKVVGAGPPNTSQVRDDSPKAKQTVPGSNLAKATGTSTANLPEGESEQSRAILDEKKAPPSISDSASPPKDGKKPSIRLRLMKKRIGRELPTKKRRQESPPKAHDAPNQQPNQPNQPVVVQESKPKKKRSSLPSPTRLPQSGAVSLCGKLTRQSDGTHKIAGTWALGLNTILADPENSKGVALDFEYDHSPSSAEGLDFPSSGTYSGWFHILGENGCKVKSPEKDVELKYVKNNQGGYNIQGQGSNVYGKFTVKGLLAQDDTITMCRQFVPSPRPPSRKRKGVDGSSAPEASTKKSRKGDTPSTSRPSTAEAISGSSKSKSSTNANADDTAEHAASDALSESVPLPDGPSSLPGTWTLGTSKKVPQYYMSSVLAGWVEQLIPRKDSKSRQARYEKFYLCPDGARFRSLVQARSYAEKLVDQVNREEDGELVAQGHHLDESTEASQPEGTDSERIEDSTERSTKISDNEAAGIAHAAPVHVNQEPQEDHAVIDDHLCDSVAKDDSLAQSQVTADTEQIDGSAREDVQPDIVTGPLAEGVVQETNDLTIEDATCSGVIVEDKEQYTEEGCAADRAKHAAPTGSTPKPAKELAEMNVEKETKVELLTKPSASADETPEPAQLTKPAASADETPESTSESPFGHESKTERVTQSAKPADVSSDSELNDVAKTEDTKLAVSAGETFQPVEAPIDSDMEEGNTLEECKPAAAVDGTFQPTQALTETEMGVESKTGKVTKPAAAVDESLQSSQEPTKMDMEIEAEEVTKPASAADEISKPAEEPSGIPLEEENRLDAVVASADVELDKVFPSRGEDATETESAGNTDEMPISLSEEPSLRQDLRNKMPATDPKDTTSMNMNILSGTERKGSSTFSAARDDPALEDGPDNVNAGDADVSDGLEHSEARPGPRRVASFNRNPTAEEQSNAGRRNSVYQKARQSAPHLKRPSSSDNEISGHSKKRRRSSSVKRVSSRVDPIKVGDPVLVLCNLSDSFGYTEKQPVYGLVKRARRSNTGLQIKVKYIDGEMSEEMPYPFADLRKLDKIPVPSDFSTFGIGDIVDSNLQDKGLFYRGRIYSIRGEWAFIEYFDGDCESAVPLNKNKTSLVQRNKNWNWIQNRPILLESDGDGADEAGYICEVNAGGCKIEINRSGETRMISHEDAAEAVFRHNCNNLPAGCENYSWGFLRPQK